ncbi:MAG: permease-like cell division protein FtsX [Cytophagaceae bacterium]|nr:permease-like cell division protein FtsX [Cytophagaceae bacterium]
MSNTTTYRRKKILGSYPVLTVFISITLSLIVMGLFGQILLNAHTIKGLMEQKAGEVQIYLYTQVSDSLQKDFYQQLSKSPYIDKQNDTLFITYTSPEQAKKEYIAMMGVDFTKVISENPLPASYTLQLKPQYIQDTANIQFIAQDFKQHPAVREVSYEKDLVQKIQYNIRLISWIVAGFALVLILVTVLLINNTIRLALYSQRFLIRSMQLVGARPYFIRKPFIVRAAWQGGLSGIFAALFLFGCLQYLFLEIPELQLLFQLEPTLYLYGGLILTGVMIGFFSSFVAVSKYLNVRLDDLY